MEERSNFLKNMQICRFCLSETESLTNIFAKLDTGAKQSTPLPLQIMACISIEAYENDGMPELICNTCRNQTVRAYVFKRNCKKSEEALKQFMVTGKLVKPKHKGLGVMPKVNVEKSMEASEPLQPLQSLPSPVKEKDVAIEEEVNEETHEIQMDYEDDSSQDIIIKDVEYEDDSVEEEKVAVEEEKEAVEEEKEEPAEQEEEEEEQQEVPGSITTVQTAVFSCPHCDRSFPLKQLLDLHMKNHSRERNFQCDECDRKFFTKYDLAKHIQTHSSYKPFECIVCKKRFGREALLHRHEKIHVDVPKYLCSQCDKTFFKKENLDNHFRLRHKKKRPFECHICKKCFVFKQGLERHEATHQEEKPHKCNYCEASFTSPIKLMRHITSHAGLRPYPCKVCGRTFLLSHHLTRHLRSHYAKSSDVEPVGRHKCDMCSMSFRRKDSLINHSAIHSMVNLKCVICNTEFSTAKEVKEHITSHLAGLPYPCDKCDYSFETQEQLEEHELKHAEMEYEEQIEMELSAESKSKGQFDFEDDKDEGNDEYTNFTIDAEGGVSEVVKTTQMFLSDVLDGSMDSDDIQNQNIMVELDDDEQGESADGQDAEEEIEEIKPIVRSEGTKVYQRKLPHRRAKEKVATTSNAGNEAPVEKTINLDNLGLTSDIVKGLPNEQYIDMKVDGIVYKVKKVTMKKTDFDEIAKQDNVEMKGGILIKKPVKVTAKNPITIENILDEPKVHPAKPPVTKTYVKRTSNASSNSQEES